MKVFLTVNNHPKWVLHDLLFKISQELGKKYNAELLYQEGGYLYIKELNYNLPDCEIVIYDKEKDILKAISFSERKTGLWDIFINRNNKKDLLICLHQRGWGINIEDLNIDFELKKTNFYTYHPNFDYSQFYNKRKNIPFKDMIDKMFFRCTTGRGDEFELERLGLTNERFTFVNLPEYLERAIKHKVGLSIAGSGEICHRDIEYMAIGLPMIRFEYVQQYDPELKPNIHYISIDRESIPQDSNMDTRGGKEYIEKYIKRYNEIKNDVNFLEIISKNAREYYEENCSEQNRLTKMLKKLNL
jgi:hypothetical protein